MTDLTELRRLLEEGTPRPWHLDSNGDSGIYTEPQPSPTSSDVATAYFDADERLIAAAVNALLDLLDAAEALEQLKAEPRDEYHTMDELYHYRMLYNALAANLMPESAVKSWRHSDGELCFGGGWFVVYLELPTGQVSNHYKAEHWDIFQIPEVKTAPEWDGHTPADAASRLLEAARRPQS